MQKRYVGIFIAVLIVACSLYFFLGTGSSVGYSDAEGSKQTIKSAGEKVDYHVKDEVDYIDGVYLGEMMHGSLEREEMKNEDKQQFMLQIMNDLQERYEKLHGIIVYLYDRDEDKIGLAYISFNDEGMEAIKKIVEEELGSDAKDIKVKENNVWYFNPEDWVRNKLVV